MLILDNSAKYFILDNNGEYAEVHQIVTGMTNLTVGHYYAVDDTCYPYIGKVDNVHSLPKGSIASFNDMLILNPYEERLLNKFSINNVISESELSSDTISVESAIMAYRSHFKNGKSVDDAYVNVMSGGDVLMPDINEGDDPFMIAIKTVLRNRGNVIISRYRDKFTEKHAIDNLRTTVLGATQNMSIDRFLTWCDILSIDWEITLVDNGTDAEHPLTNDIVINNKNHDTIEVPYPDNPDKTYFTPAYESGEDPLKRALKCALNIKCVRLRDYSDKLPTTHMLSNMRSSINRPAKHNMSVPYFVAWCEILGMGFSIRLYDPELDKYTTIDRR